MWKYRAVDFGIKKKIDWSLHTNCIDILIGSLLFDFNNNVLINSGVDLVRKLVKADKNGVYSFWFYNKVTLPGDCHGIAVGDASKWHKVRCTE